MSSEQEYNFTRALSLPELVGLSFKILFSNLFIWVYYLLVFLLFTLYLHIANDLGFPTTLYLNADELFSSIDLTNPNADSSQLINVYNQLLLPFYIEWLVISIFLAMAYAITFFFVKSNFEFNLPANLLIKSDLNITMEKKPLFTNIKTSLFKAIPKFIPIIIAALILNILILLGFFLFILPGIIISGLVSLPLI